MDEKGFTLVETMVALTIFMILVAVISLSYADSYKAFIKNSQNVEVQENLRIATNRMKREIRQATHIGEWPVKDHNIYVDSNNDGIADNDCDEIAFEIDNNVIRFYYDSSQNELQRSVNGSGNNPISSNISGLEFNYDHNGKILTINIKGKKSYTREIYLDTRVHLRAI